MSRTCYSPRRRSARCSPTGLGDSIEVVGPPGADDTATVQQAFNILQGAGVRLTKTEYVACPSCGRTLFDLQTTTDRIQHDTGHLRGVKIAVMGCIVNGPGEMADADSAMSAARPARSTSTSARSLSSATYPRRRRVSG